GAIKVAPEVETGLRFEQHFLHRITIFIDTAREARVERVPFGQGQQSRGRENLAAQVGGAGFPLRARAVDGHLKMIAPGGQNTVARVLRRNLRAGRAGEQYEDRKPHSFPQFRILRALARYRLSRTGAWSSRP